eukprot:scaffold52295_cov23-Tisochrysis_lutea.AAC.1
MPAQLAEDMHDVDHMLIKYEQGDRADLDLQHDTHVEEQADSMQAGELVVHKDSNTPTVYSTHSCRSGEHYCTLPQSFLHACSCEVCMLLTVPCRGLLARTNGVDTQKAADARAQSIIAANAAVLEQQQGTAFITAAAKAESWSTIIV